MRLLPDPESLTKSLPNPESPLTVPVPVPEPLNPVSVGAVGKMMLLMLAVHGAYLEYKQASLY
jgi:hypothetical protein